ncbi:putative disease resistance protein RGA3 [Cryptomeria japonica]|uniref:putative disease resistance protein RGA3 n=1 Tax=Cryptomeria japonica TaxID=3369 RepID=UPI0027DA3C4C|nr:putative disease resistance protein RGA3 [Cryptomeria japonica]
METVLAAAVVGKVRQMVLQEVTNEISLVMNFREDFEELKNKIEQINCFLKEADGERSEKKESVINWLKRARDLAWRAEDIVEECAFEFMYGNITQSCTLSYSQLIFRLRMGRRIKKVKARLSSIVKEGDELKIYKATMSSAAAEASTSAPAQGKKSSLLPRDSHPVGIDSKVEHLISLLEDPQVPIIAVVGMGGLGKTFLLQNFYNRAKSRFDYSIWLSISKSYSVKDLQNDIASHIDLQKEIVNVSEVRAAELIRGSLEVEGKRSLIVLDDVWTFSYEDNLIDKLGLPAERYSNLVISTRNMEVAESSKARIYNLENLSDEDSWRLFCAYAFPEREGNRPPPEVEEEGRKIVRQCGNLPLAIKTIAASLSTSRHVSEWESKSRQLQRAVTRIPNRDPVNDILKLSYDSLPAHLKACFAYLSFFPEDTEIDCEYLINLWIGEGFVPAGKDQWDMAWHCLYELVNLCLLQLWEDRGMTVLHSTICYKLSKNCKIHDLLHDLAIKVSRENKCAFSVDRAITDTSDDTGCCRILLAKQDINDNAFSQSRPVCLRTVSLSQKKEIRSIPAHFFRAMRGLRVLDLSSTSISALPASIGKMKLLKVLNLRDTLIEEVPECHLECESINRIPKGLSKLASLRILRSSMLELSMEEDEFASVEDLVKMTELQELQFNVNDDMELKRIEDGILAELMKMRRLRIAYKTGAGTELPQFPEKMRAMKHLESLH